MLLVWTGIMVAAAPVAAMAMSDSVYCAKVMAPQPAMMQANGHMDHSMHGAPDGQMPRDTDRGKSAVVCCDHACLSDLAVAPRWQISAVRESRVIVAWAASDRAGLTEPTGPRRPPKG
ncbi:hypothetical protein [Pseudooceanicola sp. LIPI14-2-Ac024]|uniref:hypothetical protein n=1 Tax=Pseudooceanicola sp. LIPI14-2-Ac024 TaxID=3344875 RepID=UPI0035CF8FC4